MYRTHTCGELAWENVGQEVKLAWWVNKLRNLWWMTFIDLRDRYGITQVTVNPDKIDATNLRLNSIHDIKVEYVLQISWKVVSRPDNMINKDMVTWEVEIEPSEVKILTTSKLLPFSIVDEPNTSEENRFKHRYLDLRRKKILDNIIFRSKMTTFTRNWFTKKWFTDVQTPIFTVSSPEWARDFLIPSRVNPGQFYALPQAPQQYKQLLMIWWIDKYFQIAPCFRDEDPRADRHSCEFYQIDCEMSFVEKDDVFAVVQDFLSDLVRDLSPEKQIVVNFRKLQRKEAIDLYGSDKPDLRFGMEFVEMTNDFEKSDFVVFKEVIKNKWSIKAMKRENKIISRKEADELTEIVKLSWAKWLAYICLDAEGVKWSISKFLTEVDIENIKSKLDAKIGDTVFFVADNYNVVTSSLWKLRLQIRDKYLNISKDLLSFCWIDNFPMFELDEKTWNLDFGHNPFAMAQWGSEALKNPDKLKIVAEQYDLACNWYEILSWSIRNHDPKLLLEAFKIVWRWEDEIKKKFGAMYEAFQYWPPPHGGFAIWFDRLLMILKNEDNIREVYAFPKSGRAQDVMMWAPSVIDKGQLDELFVEVKEVE